MTGNSKEVLQVEMENHKSLLICLFLIGQEQENLNQSHLHVLNFQYKKETK